MEVIQITGAHVSARVRPYRLRGVPAGHPMFRPEFPLLDLNAFGERGNDRIISFGWEYKFDHQEETAGSQAPIRQPRAIPGAGPFDSARNIRVVIREEDFRWA